MPCSCAASSASALITSPAALTRAGIILGTAAYMAPEQARGRAVDKRAGVVPRITVIQNWLAEFRQER